MQNHQTRHMSAPTGPSNLKPDDQTTSDSDRTNGGNKSSSKKVAPNTQDAKEPKGKEGRTAWHMEQWLNETTKESTWSVHGRF
ncbi:hypothetical protein COCMIDRAFT_7505 [Bipolaris oryzae ATCC 44560]|uniref:Uncharacterized protein n=1 Tax=Bipolaris oryzae ATCC 44560 TaxID=930090 RepID=W6YZE4_COCMI|nr:uncharacterized protein COCMIDRAFT_7505 [Bipolaris oryzae ATCC 44560]EUC42958.1 hypothetical protein COCMIDRAFT_7505 [Bipolaris oryzae ATCC 44560]